MYIKIKISIRLIVNLFLKIQIKVNIVKETKSLTIVYNDQINNN